MTEAPAKKRDTPVRAAPVVHKGVRYSAQSPVADTWGSDPLPASSPVDLVAEDAGSGAELWRTTLYTVDFDPDMERDKQEIYVTQLSLNLLRTALKAVDERGRRYRIDLKSRAVAVQ